MNRSVSKKLWGVAGIAVFAMALSACAGPPQGADQGETVVVALPSQSTQVSWDAGYVGSEDYIDMQVLLHAGLIQKDYIASTDEGVVTQDVATFSGYLAEGYTVSDDGLTYTFTLKDDVVSQAGNPLTVDDVIWSFERKFDPATAGLSKALFATAGVTGMDQITKIDDSSMAITVPRAGDGYTLLGVLADSCGQIYDSTFLEEHATDDDPYAVEWTASNTGFGFGPYEVESMTDGSETVLVANADYVLGEPEIKRVVRRVVPEVGNRLNALKSGDADIALALRPSDMAELQDDDSVFAPSIDTNQLLEMNLVVNKAPFDKVEVRQAWAYAIDYDRIIDEIYSGQATKQNTYLTPSLAGYSAEGLPDWSYDPDASKELLAEAGVTGDVPFTLTISNADPVASDIAVTLKDSAADAGFDVQIKEVTPTQLAETSNAGSGQAYIGWGSAWNLSPPYMLLLNYDPVSGDSKWSSAEYEAAIQRGFEAGDVTSDAAGAEWNAAEQIWLNSASKIIIAKLGPASAMSSTLTDWTWRTDGALDLSVVKYR